MSLTLRRWHSACAVLTTRRSKLSQIAPATARHVIGPRAQYCAFATLGRSALRMMYHASYMIHGLRAAGDLLTAAPNVYKLTREFVRRCSPTCAYINRRRTLDGNLLRFPTSNPYTTLAGASPSLRSLYSCMVPVEGHVNYFAKVHERCSAQSAQAD